jgi:hypothetical protein
MAVVGVHNQTPASSHHQIPPPATSRRLSPTTLDLWRSRVYQQRHRARAMSDPSSQTTRLFHNVGTQTEQTDAGESE